VNGSSRIKVADSIDILCSVKVLKTSGCFVSLLAVQCQ
jgi:hypothetical protein